jgi:uncharacterized protein YyaL (SSP411 family)
LIADAARRYPAGFGRALSALDFHLSQKREIVIMGEGEDANKKALEREVWRDYLPNKVVALATPHNHPAGELIPLLRERPLIDGKATAYVCEHFSCRQPVTTAEALRQELSRSLKDGS